MSDFLTEDIDKLLESEAEKKNDDDKAYETLLKNDRNMMSGFSVSRKQLHWPEPVRKRHIR
jgi:hypothetical protein